MFFCLPVRLFFKIKRKEEKRSYQTNFFPKTINDLTQTELEFWVHASRSMTFGNEEIPVMPIVCFSGRL